MYRTVAAVSILSLATILGACAGPKLRDAGGGLQPCGMSHCVSSQSSDPDYHVEPIRYPGTREAARAALLRILTEMPRLQIESATDDYIHATVTTEQMDFVDDLELLFPADERVVHVRSSSRVGYFDYGVNRKRVEEIRAAFAAIQP